MIFKKRTIQRRFHATLLLTCLLILLSGCTKTPTETQGTTPPAETPSQTESNTTNNVEQANPQANQPESTTSDAEGLPSGVTVKKVIKDEAIKNNYRKKVELLTDGGKRITITDASDKIVLRNLEYEGIITEATGNQVTVQVKNGGQQTLTIPSQVVIEDEDNLGLNKGVEIEWTLNTDGQIESVELED